MATDDGRSPSGPGYSAEPEPSFTVSAADAVSIPNAEWDDSTSFIVKVPMGRGWGKWGRGRFYLTEDEAQEAADLAAKSHGRARIIRQEIRIRQETVRTIDVRQKAEVGDG